MSLVLILALGLIAVNAAGLIDLTLESIGATAGSVLSATENATGTGINETETERLIHSKVNERRIEHGLSKVAWDGELQTIPGYHSERMATDEFFAHTAPDGETRADRYDKHGYDCRIPTGGRSVKTGGENIAQSYHHENVRGHGYISTEEELAEAIVTSWMESEGHRQNLLDPDWRRQGIGVQLAAGGKVYATQNFC